MSEELFRTLLLAAISLILVITGVMRRPGVGVLLSLAAIAYLLWSRNEGLAQLGLQPQDSWLLTILLSLGLGALIGLLSMSLIDPLVERLTGRPHDISIVEGTRGNFLALALWIIAVWILVAFFEELIFRGYLMLEFIHLVGDSPLAVTGALIFSSIVFGIAHLYQGPSGAISTSIIAIILGVVFIISGFNLWLLILIHGFIDTIQLILISMKQDSRVRGWFMTAGG